MGNALPCGSEVRVRKQSVYWPGDIVLFARGDGQLVSHRMLGYLPGRTGWLVLTQADAESHPDPVIPASRVLGAVEAINGQPARCSLRWRVRSLARFVSGTLLWARHRLIRPAATNAL